MKEKFVWPFLLSIFACTADDDKSQLTQKIQIDERPLYPLSTALWNTSRISVCWENPVANNAPERGWVRDAVENSWPAVAPLEFIGWNACARSTRGIRIRIEDSGPHTKGLGTQLDGRTDGMVLNFQFVKWSPACQFQREFCIRAIAVHEFGHALGFAHEQNRPDTPTWCDLEQGSNGDFLVGGWDLDSVMNYCNPEWNGDGDLSAGDIEAVRRLYPPIHDTVDAWHEGGIPTRLMVGDFDGDHFDDVLQARGEADTSPPRYFFFTHLSNGDGFFTQHGYDTNVAWSEGGIPTELLVGDFNGDDRDDVVQARGETDTQPHRYLLLTYFSAGNGTYTRYGYDTNLFWSEGDIPTRFLVGDFNGDGRDDIVQARGETDTAPRRYFFFTYLSNGDGNYVAHGHDTNLAWAEGGIPTELLVGDFNGDGRDDILQARGEADSAPHRYILYTHLSNGNGTYAEHSYDTNIVWSEGPIPTRLLVGDFNGDGRDDVVQARGEADTLPHRYIFLTYISNGGGSYSTFGYDTNLLWSEGAAPTEFRVGRLDADQDDDILLARGEADDGPQRYLLLPYLSQGNGWYLRSGDRDTSRAWSSGGVPTRLLLGDFANDGVDDVVQAVGESRTSPARYVFLSYLRAP